MLTKIPLFISKTASYIFPQTKLGQDLLFTSLPIHSYLTQRLSADKNFSVQKKLASSCLLSLVTSATIRFFEKSKPFNQSLFSSIQGIAQKIFPQYNSTRTALALASTLFTGSILVVSNEKQISDQAIIRACLCFSIATPILLRALESFDISSTVLPSLTDNVAEKTLEAHNTLATKIHSDSDVSNIFSFSRNGKRLNSEAFFQLLKESDQFCLLFHEQLKSISKKYPKGFFLRSSPILFTEKANGNYFFFTAISHEFSTKEIDFNAFNGKLSDQSPVAFKSTGKSGATLVCPEKNASSTYFHHLSSFCEHATDEQAIALWKSVAQEALKQPKDRLFWVNTDGTGVSFLHVRIEPTPYYYPSDSPLISMERSNKYFLEQTRQK